MPRLLGLAPSLVESLESLGLSPFTLAERPMEAVPLVLVEFGPTLCVCFAWDLKTLEGFCEDTLALACLLVPALTADLDSRIAFWVIFFLEDPFLIDPPISENDLIYST